MNSKNHSVDFLPNLEDRCLIPSSPLQEADRYLNHANGTWVSSEVPQKSSFSELSDCPLPSYKIIPDEPGTGRSQAKLTTDFWQWSYSIPADQNPFYDETGEFAHVNQSGPVFFLTGALFVPGGANPAEPGTTRDIEVPRGKEIFLPVLNVEWDNAQLQTFFGTDDPNTPENENFFTDLPDNGVLSPKELRNLNENNMQTATAMFFKINGDTLFTDADWGDDEVMRHRQVTPTPKGFNYKIPENNVLGLPLEATDNGRGLVKGGMSDGIWINLELDPGYHVGRTHT